MEENAVMNRLGLTRNLQQQPCQQCHQSYWWQHLVPTWPCQLVMCWLQPEAKSQAKLGQAKPGLRWASAWPGEWESQSQAKAGGLGPGFCTHEIWLKIAVRDKSLPFSQRYWDTFKLSFKSYMTLKESCVLPSKHTNLGNAMNTRLATSHFFQTPHCGDRYFHSPPNVRTHNNLTT